MLPGHQFASSCHLPCPDGAVLRGAEQRLGIVGEGDGLDGGAVADQELGLGIRVGEQQHALVLAGGSERRSVG